MQHTTQACRHVLLCHVCSYLLIEHVLDVCARKVWAGQQTLPRDEQL